MLFSRNAPSSQIQQSPSITFQGCVSNFSLLVTRGLGRMWLAQHWYLTTSRKLARAYTLVMQQMCHAAVAGPLLAILSPLLGRGGQSSKKTRNQEREGEREGEQPANCSQNAEVAPQEKARTATLSILSPSLPPKPVPLPHPAPN